MEVGLPAGDVQTFRLASTVPEDRLPWMGVWRSLADVLTGDPDVREAAADGLLWSLTPGEEVRLVHAVPRPVSAPRPTVVVPFRARGSVLTSLVGGVEVHGPSTDKLTASLAWTDLVDDVTLDGPVERSSAAAGFEIAVRRHDRILPLWLADQTVPLPGFEGVVLRDTVHPMPDTRHHVVRYRFRASTRFREYFAPALLAGDPADPLDDGQSVVSDELVVSLPSTERPDPPRVHSVLPLFRWRRPRSRSSRSGDGGCAGPACGSTSSGRGTPAGTARCSRSCWPSATTRRRPTRCPTRRTPRPTPRVGSRSSASGARTRSGRRPACRGVR